jgi:hypothetical protein
VSVGVRQGVNVGGGGAPPDSFTRDGPGNVIVPVSAADWIALGKPAPLEQWNCQDASGNLAPAVGALSLIAQGSNLVYEQVIAGWARRFVGFSAETASARWETLDASLDAAAGQSVAWFYLFAAAPASTGNRLIAQVSQAGVNNLRCTATLYQHTHNAAATNAATAPSLATVLAGIWYRNATTDVSGLILPGDHTTGTHDESAYTAGTRKCLGNSGATSAVCLFGLAAVWLGADAEAIAVPSTLTDMGW